MMPRSQTKNHSFTLAIYILRLFVTEIIHGEWKSEPLTYKMHAWFYLKPSTLRENNQ